MLNIQKKNFDAENNNWKFKSLHYLQIDVIWNKVHLIMYAEF